MQSHFAPLPSLLLSPTQARPSIYTFQGTKRKPSKVEIKVVGSIIKKFYLERVESKKWNVVSLFFPFFLRSKNRVGREKRILAYLRYEGHLNVKTMN